MFGGSSYYTYFFGINWKMSIIQYFFKKKRQERKTTGRRRGKGTQVGQTKRTRENREWKEDGEREERWRESERNRSIEICADGGEGTNASAASLPCAGCAALTAPKACPGNNSASVRF